MSGPMKATTVAVFLFLAPFAQGQTTVSRDPQAVSLLTQSVNAAFGSTGLSTYRDFTATGTITYFWAGDQVLGSATVKGRGPAEFRIDASLPMGTRSYAVNYGVGALKDTDGTLKPIPFHNTVNVGVLSFPYPTIAAALSNALTSMVMVGTTTVNGRAAYQVRVQQTFSSTQDPDSTLAKLCVTDYFLDSQSLLIVMFQD